MKRRTFTFLAASALALTLGAGTAYAQNPANVARNKTLIVAAQTEAPVYRNVGPRQSRTPSTTRTSAARSSTASSLSSTTTRTRTR